MISDLLLALSGIPGDVIVHESYTSPAMPDRFIISSRAMEMDIVLPHERDLVEKRLLPVAFAVKVLKEFAQREDAKRRRRSGDDESDGVIQSSSRDHRNLCAYRRGLLSGIDQAVLQPYEQRLLLLEQKILKGQIEPNANAIEEFLGEFTVSVIGTMDALKKILEDEDEEDGFYGAKLLDELAFRYRQCGSFETKEALRILRRFAMRAFYGHCFVWLAFGTVAEEQQMRRDFGRRRRRELNNKGSFFIGAVREEDVMTQRLERLDMNEEEEEDDDDEKENSMMKNTDEYQIRYFQDDDYLENAKILPTDGGASAWRDAFAVKIEQTPKRMSASDAEAVHFVGRCVRALRLHRRALELRRRKKFGSIKETNAKKADIDAFLDEHARETGKEIESLVLGIREDESKNTEKNEAAINDGEDDFDDFTSLAVVVNKAKRRVSKKLGEVIDSETYDVNDKSASSSFVTETFASLRNFFLLQRGDIFSSLLDDEDSIFIVPGSEKSGMKSAKKRIESAWEDAVADNKYDGASERFSLKRGDKNYFSETNTVSSCDGFDDVYMSYERTWPVVLLVTDFALEKYGAIFKSLFRLRRARSALSRVWQNISRHNRSSVTALQMSNNTGNGFETDANGVILRSRTAIDFALRNWEQYASEDVIAHRWSSFAQSMTSSAGEGTAVDFEKATKAHREFIVSVSRELFVKDGSMVRKKKKDASDVEKAVAEISNLAFTLELLSQEYRDINDKEIEEETSDEQKLYTNEHLVTKTEHVLSRAQECTALLCSALRSEVLGVSDVTLHDKVDALLFRLEFNKQR
jgi:hypothetical protein